MAASVTVINVKNVGPKWYVSYSDGVSMEYATFDDMQSSIGILETVDQARTWAVAWWLARDSDGSNQNLIVGKKITIDAGAANPIRVQ